MNRALLVGINAYPDSPLRGCVNDVEDMSDFLVGKCGFVEREIRLLTDKRATTGAILERLLWLIKGARAGDRLFFHYSGHGVQLTTRDSSGEVDGLDEAVCPFDFDWSDEHAIRDKDFARLFKAVPAGVNFIWVSDSCHSGDLIRAPSRSARGTPRTRTPAAGQSAIRWIGMPADMAWRIRTATALHIKPGTLGRAVHGLNLALITGCRSDQTSADAFFSGRFNGALTYMLLRGLRARNGLCDPLKTIVPRVRGMLKKAGFTQEPQLEGNAGLHRMPFLAAGGEPEKPEIKV